MSLDSRIFPARRIDIVMCVVFVAVCGCEFTQDAKENCQRCDALLSVDDLCVWLEAVFDCYDTA